jgi:hypothetical protein
MAAFEAATFMPRSSGSSFWRPLADLLGSDLDELAKKPIDLRKAEFHPRGESRVKEVELLAWREKLNEWAYGAGFPSTMNLAQRSTWDIELGIQLLEDTSGLPESLHPDVWCWIAVHLLPHFVVHRWGWPASADGQPPRGRAKWARFGPDPRNGLRVAIHRVGTYGPDIARKANQEEFQSIQNRPAFSLDPRVSRVILSTIVDALDDPSSHYGKSNDGQLAHRRMDANLVGMELRFINSMRPLCFATDREIELIVSDVIDRLPDLRTRHAAASEDEEE